MTDVRRKIAFRKIAEASLAAADTLVPR